MHDDPVPCQNSGDRVKQRALKYTLLELKAL